MTNLQDIWGRKLLIFIQHHCPDVGWADPLRYDRGIHGKWFGLVNPEQVSEVLCGIWFAATTFLTSLVVREVERLGKGMNYLPLGKGVLPSTLKETDMHLFQMGGITSSLSSHFQ